MAGVAIETALSHAIESRQIELVYQVQREVATRKVCGAEALLRWRHPQYGTIETSQIIGIAEETGLILPIGAFVLEEACRQAVRWQKTGGPDFVAVNVSSRQFEARDFVKLVEQTLLRTRLDPRRLHLEVTEGLVMRGPETAIAVLRSLKQLGVQLVIDDFGTGYSSLDYLKRFPLDALKIDKTFVRDIAAPNRSAHDEVIVRAVVALADALGLRTIAEGVESEAQASLLLRLGCAMGQGFLFGYPVAGSALDGKVAAPTVEAGAPLQR